MTHVVVIRLLVEFDVLWLATGVVAGRQLFRVEMVLDVPFVGSVEIYSINEDKGSIPRTVWKALGTSFVWWRA